MSRRCFATGAANDAIREGGRHGGGPRARRALGTLVVAEIALSLVLLAGAGLFIPQLIALQNVEPGMRTEGGADGPSHVIGAALRQRQKMSGFYTATIANQRDSGVENAAAVSFLPMAGLGIGTSFTPP